MLGHGVEWLVSEDSDDSLNAVASGGMVPTFCYCGNSSLPADSVAQCKTYTVCWQQCVKAVTIYWYWYLICLSLILSCSMVWCWTTKTNSNTHTYTNVNTHTYTPWVCRHCTHPLLLLRTLSHPRLLLHLRAKLQSACRRGGYSPHTHTCMDTQKGFKISLYLTCPVVF